MISNDALTFQKIPSDKNQKQNSKESTQVISRPGQTQDQTGVNTLRQRRNLSGQPNIVVCKNQHVLDMDFTIHAFH